MLAAGAGDEATICARPAIRPELRAACRARRALCAAVAPLPRALSGRKGGARLRRRGFFAHPFNLLEGVAGLGWACARHLVTAWNLSPGPGSWSSAACNRYSISRRPTGRSRSAAPCVFAVLFYVDARRKRGRRISVAGFFRSIFPARILWHPSSRLDVRLWIANTLVFASAYGMFAIRQPVVAQRNDCPGDVDFRRSRAHRLAAMGDPGERHAARIARLRIWLLGQPLSFPRDPRPLGIPKVHHSAEVLTTLTEMRTHPVEIIFFMNVIGLCTGIVFGAMTYAVRTGHPPLHSAQRQCRADAFHRDDRAFAPFAYVDRLHRPGRPDFSKARPTTRSTIPTSRAISTRISASRWRSGIGCSGRFTSPRNIEKITFGVGAEHIRFDTLLKSFCRAFLTYSADHLRDMGGRPESSRARQARHCAAPLRMRRRRKVSAVRPGSRRH